jgi:tetratricopeptide (TPR) repeat protein
MFIPLLVVAAGLLAYHNSFTAPFIFDDEPSIRDNPTIRHLWPIWQPLSPPHEGGTTVEGRPLINLSLAINYALGGTKLWGYHALNLAIHILAGLTLLGVVRRTLQQPRLRARFGAVADELALATAVLWTVHPLQTESVTYVVQRAESIMGLFYLLTLYCFIRGADSPRPRPWYGLCVSACALGMASKEVMVSAPLLVMLYDRTFVSGSFCEAWRRRRPLYLALAATWSLLGLLAVLQPKLGVAVANARSKGIAWWSYLLTEPGVILHYLRLSVWPHPLCFDYDGWPLASTWASILPPALVIVTLLGATAWAWKTNSAWGIVGAWFFLILAPSSSFLPADSPAYEHRMYLPLAAVVVLGVSALYALLGRRTVPVAVMLAVGLGFLTARRNEDYRSVLSIWTDTVTKRPNNARAHNNLANDLAAAGRVSEAIEHYEQSLRLRQDNPEVHNNLGNAFSNMGRVREAIGEYEQALRLMPGSPNVHYNLGVALERAGRLEDAIAHYEQAARLKPDYVEAHGNLGNALAQAGQVKDAIEQLQIVLRLTPDSLLVHYNLGNAFLQAGQTGQAIAQYEQALQLKPDYAEAHNNLGNAFLQAGQVKDAIEHFEQAARLKPDSPLVHKNLGSALEQSGRIPEAIDHYQEALRLNPDYAEAQTALARLQCHR